MSFEEGVPLLGPISKKKIVNAAELSIRALQKIWACNTNKDSLIILSFG